MKKLLLAIATIIVILSCEKRHFMPNTVPGGRPKRPLPDTIKKTLPDTITVTRRTSRN